MQVPIDNYHYGSNYEGNSEIQNFENLVCIYLQILRCVCFYHILLGQLEFLVKFRIGYNLSITLNITITISFNVQYTNQ